MKHSVVIVGGGAGGIATAASLLALQRNLDVLVVEPAAVHYYQPGWTLVGAGIFDAASTARPMHAVMPKGVRWLQAEVVAVEPRRNKLILGDLREIEYDHLVLAPGLELHWEAISGLARSLGRNGVTSNYRQDLAPYTWQLIRSLRSGRALFTQPPLPVKCTGAPQKAMYLAADHWRHMGALGRIDLRFCTAGAALFSVPAYVPALEQAVSRYGIHVHFGERLVAVDAAVKQAIFEVRLPDGTADRVTRDFDILHVVPPQRAPRFVRESELADPAGWLDLDPTTLQHVAYANIYGLGDVSGTSNSKTAAAARRQAPVVAVNLLRDRGTGQARAAYDGYSSCPITVARGKVVLAEFAYGGKLSPTFASWLIDGTKPSKLAWQLKAKFFPYLYWNGMLKGKHWLAKPPQRNGL